MRALLVDGVGNECMRHVRKEPLVDVTIMQTKNVLRE